MNTDNPQDVSSELFALISKSNSQNPDEEGSGNLSTSLSSINYPTVPSQQHQDQQQQQQQQQQQYQLQQPSGSVPHDNNTSYSSAPQYHSKTPPPGMLPSAQPPPPPPQAQRSASYPTSPDMDGHRLQSHHPQQQHQQQQQQQPSPQLSHFKNFSHQLPRPTQPSQPQDLSTILNIPAHSSPSQQDHSLSPSDPLPISTSDTSSSPQQQTLTDPTSAVQPVEVREHQMRLDGEHVMFEPRPQESVSLQNFVEISTAEPQPVAPGHRLITSNKDYLACVLRSRMIRVFHKYSSQRGVLKRHEQPITEIRFMSRESNIAASASQDGALIVWEISSSESQFGFNILYKFKSNSPVVRMAWNPGQHLQLIFACANGSLIMCDLTSVVNQEDTAPHMEYLMEEDPDDYITSADFSWDGQRMVTASKQGTLMVWDTDEFKVLEKWTPHGNTMINNVRILGSHVATQYSNFLITAAQSNRELKVWNMEGDCIQTLNIRSDFPLDVFEQETSSRHIVLASSESAYMCVLRLTLSEDGHQCTFDLVSEFNTSYPVLSISPISQLKEDMVHIGVFSMLKNKGICLLHIESSQINWAEEPFEKPAVPSPSSSSSTSHDTSHGKAKPPSPTTTPTSTPPTHHTVSPRKSQPAPATPDTKPASSSPPMSQRKEEKEAEERTQTSQIEIPESEPKSNPASIGNISSEQLQNMIDESITKALHQQEQIREHKYKEKQIVEHQQQRELLEHISQILSDDVPDTIEQTVENCFEQTVMPSLERSLSDSVENKLSNSIQQITNTNFKSLIPKLEKTLQESLKSTLAKELNDNMPKNMEQSIDNAVQHHLRSNFQELVIPSFEEICRRMFSQINDAFQRGLQDHVGNLTSNNNNNEAILEQLQNISQQLNRLEESQRRSSRQPISTETKPSRSRIQEADIQRMIASKDYDTLFFEVLSTSNLNVLLSVCSRLDPSQVINSNLSSVTLLSLVQQLGFDLTSHTSMKVTWLQKAILKLPNIHEDFITQKSPAILKQVRQNAFKAMQHVNSQDREGLQILSHILDGLLINK